MISKIFRGSAVTLLAVSTLVTSAAGARISSLETSTVAGPTYLKCRVEKLTKSEIVLNVLNNTTRTVPRGTKIHWSVNRGTKGSFVLDAALPPGKSVTTTEKPSPPGSEFKFNPQPEPPFPEAKAWFYE
jgi:hypothetical protein